MKVGKTFQPGLLSTCEGGFQGTLMVLLDTMGRFYNRNSLTPRHLKTYWQCTGLRVVLHKRYISQDKVSYHLLRSRIYTEGRPRLVLGRVFSQRKWSFHVDWRRLGCHVRWCSSLHPMSKKTSFEVWGMLDITASSLSWTANFVYVISWLHSLWKTFRLVLQFTSHTSPYGHLKTIFDNENRSRLK